MQAPERMSMYEIALRLSLVVVAFLILTRIEEPTILEIPTLEDTASLDEIRGPIGPALLALASGLAAGVLFGVAGRPLSGWTYSPGLPVLLGLIPAIIVIFQVLVFSEVLPLGDEGVLRRLGSFFVSDFPLRASSLLLGVALAQGVVSASDD